MHDTAEKDHRALHLLYDTSGIGFWRLDQDGYTISMNPAMLAMIEVSSLAELEGKTYHQFFTPESIERMRTEHGKRRQGITSSYEVELIGMKGTHRNVVISGVPATNDAGELIGLVGTLTDITEMKRVESALRASETRLRSVIAASVDAIGVSRNGVHVMVNPAYVRMFGAADERDLVGTSILELIAPDQRETISNYVRLRFAGQTDVTHYMTRGLRRDGREFPMEVHVSSYEENGAFHTVVILRDLTEQLALEEQLRQSQKMDALGRLAGGVAHDFNNLLTVIMSCADLALRALPAQTAAIDHVQLIRSTGERAATLTRQLLALSRRQVIDPKVVDLNAVVSELATLLRRLLGSHIRLVVDTDPSLARVRVDVSQLEQVIMNLCLNGRDAMPNGGTLEISTRNMHAPALLDAKPGPYAVVSVRDHGQGMTPEVQSRLFEPFFTTKPPGHGTGLGLSTVYGIVKQSGGHVTVDTVLGEGSTFHVYLPAAEAVAVSAPPVQPIAVKQAGTVLLVDDEALLRDLITRFLSAAGYRVIVAADGEEGLAKFREHQSVIDMVVTDMLMPQLSGVELMAAIDKIIPNMRVLFMSGYAFDGASILTARPGSAFVAKPFTLPELGERIATMLGAARAR